MLRSLRTAVAIAVLCAISVSLSATAFAATPTRKATLTATEYKQLTQQLAALKKFDHSKRATWNQGYAACRKAGQTTKLLRSVRVNCDTVMGYDQSLVGFGADAERCTALSTTGTTTSTTPTGTTPTDTTTETTTTGTTTTGTTTTGELTATQLQVLACLMPEYDAISRAARSVYTSQAGLRQQVLARHFIGRCLLTLAPTRGELQELKRFVASSKKLAADVTLISKVSAGQVPASQINEVQIDKDAKAFGQTGQAVYNAKRPQKLSVCPHQ